MKLTLLEIFANGTIHCNLRRFSFSSWLVCQQPFGKLTLRCVVQKAKASK